ncbi:MAG: GtrA family protein [Novosphingobium sp.]
MLRRALDLVFLRYLAASALALGIDLGTFLALLSLGLEAAIAAAVGYTLGIVAHWVVSSRVVFADGVAQRGPERNRQKALFIGSALAGLALTTAIVGLGTRMGLDPRLAKLAAIAASFMLTWLLRERVVFKVARTP